MTSTRRAKVLPSRSGARRSPPQSTKASAKPSRRPSLRSTRGDDAFLAALQRRLSGSTFRVLNEQLYTHPSSFGAQMLGDPRTFAAYHQGYREQLALWPSNPIDVVVEAIVHRRGLFAASKAGRLPTSEVIADFGCGEATLGAKLKAAGYQRISNFDFCAASPEVTVADVAVHVPLATASVGVVVMVLSLMSTDWMGAVKEAARVLGVRGLLKIVEVRSRIPDVGAFIGSVAPCGFRCLSSDVINDYFVAIDLERVAEASPAWRRATALDEVLLPCLYKRR